MEEITHLGLPWRMLKDKLVRTDPDTRRVRYMDTFDNVRFFIIHTRVSFIPVILENKLSINTYINRKLQCAAVGVI